MILGRLSDAVAVVTNEERRHEAETDNLPRRRCRSVVGAPVEPREDSLRIFLENAAHLAGDGRHVDADQLVDVNVTRRRVEKMKALGMTCEYIEVPGGSHSSAGRENIGKVLAFLAEQQKP